MTRLNKIVVFALIFVCSTSGYAQLSNEKWGDIINKKDAAWFATKEAHEIAENVLLYQRDIGGWPKNIQMQNPLTDEEKKQLIALKSSSKGVTTDNKATTQEMLFLSKMYAQIHDRSVKKH